MIKMDRRGQVSAELILLLGIIFVVVIVVAGYAGEQNELNAVSAAAKDGAMKSVSDITLLNRNIGPVRVESVNLTEGKNKTIQIKLSGSLSSSYDTQIINQTLNSIAAQGFDRENDTIVTGRYRYNVTII